MSQHQISLNGRSIPPLHSGSGGVKTFRRGPSCLSMRVPTVRPPSGRSLTRPGAAPSDAQPQHVGSGSEGDGGDAARLGAVTARFSLRPAAAAAHQGSARPGFSSQCGPRPARRVRPAVSGSHSRTRIAIRSGTA